MKAEKIVASLVIGLVTFLTGLVAYLIGATVNVTHVPIITHSILLFFVALIWILIVFGLYIMTWKLKTPLSEEFPNE